jgi:predicted dinucleotide-binding enzyme
MKIGIIGSGNIGGTLTRRLQAAGHDVTVSNSRGPQTLKGLTEETGARAATVEEAARDSELVVLAVPVAAVPSLPADAFRDKVVVDADNYYPERDGDIPEVADNSLTSSRWTAAHLQGARVVKAFSTIYAQPARGGRPGRPDRVALPVAADDMAAKRTVMALVDELGFGPIDAGAWTSWRRQPGTPVYGTDHGGRVRRILPRRDHNTRRTTGRRRYPGRVLADSGAAGSAPSTCWLIRREPGGPGGDPPPWMTAGCTPSGG